MALTILQATMRADPNARMEEIKDAIIEAHRLPTASKSSTDAHEHPSSKRQESWAEIHWDALYVLIIAAINYNTFANDDFPHIPTSNSSAAINISSLLRTCLLQRFFGFDDLLLWKNSPQEDDAVTLPELAGDNIPNSVWWLFVFHASPSLFLYSFRAEVCRPERHYHIALTVYSPP